jgi:hypothetical protein
VWGVKLQGGSRRGDLMENRRSDMARVWTLQTAVLACAALVVFWGFYAVDHFAVGAGHGTGGFLGRYFSFDPNSVSNGVSSLSGVNIAVFGIVITVVSIIVQLTADRYSGVARMFLSDRINLLVPAYYVVACVVSVWMSTGVKDQFVPRGTLTMVLSLTMGGLVIMAPYFSYVFWFLEPRHIIDRIREGAVERATSGALKRDKANCYAAQAHTLFAIEELTDITNNSISGRDKIIASGAVDALRDLALEYLKVKPEASPSWFSIGPQIKGNPDFVAMDPESLGDLENRRTWVEWKVMRQFLSIYNEALGSMRDINYLIAIDTRYIGEAAARAGDAELIELVYRYFNSYLRSTLNAKEVRTAYNVLHQYRKLVETMLEIGNHKAATDGVKHIKYYGIVSFDMNLSFITETAAYDLSTLAQLANELGSPVEHDILAEFLELDRPPHMRGQQKALMGVRKAQVKLAAYYLAVGIEDRAREIAQDMRDEPRERLLTIQNQLASVQSKDFWEIIDRGRNFEYMPPHQRACLETFFDWLDIHAETPSA